MLVLSLQSVAVVAVQGRATWRPLQEWPTLARLLCRGMGLQRDMLRYNVTCGASKQCHV